MDIYRDLLILRNDSHLALTRRGRQLALTFSIAHARKAEKLITLIAIPAYDPTIKVNIILIISCTMDV